MHSLCSMPFHTAAKMKYGVNAWSILATVWIKIHTTYTVECTNTPLNLLYLLCLHTSCLYDLRVIKMMFCSVLLCSDCHSIDVFVSIFRVLQVLRLNQ